MSGASALVLIVDDDEDNRFTYGAALERGGFRVEVASNGLEALAKIATARPDIVIMDLAMPLMDGLEATRAIRSNAETLGIPVIAVSGSSVEQLQRAYDAGVDEICRKPCLPEDLIAIVEQLLSERPQR